MSPHQTPALVTANEGLVFATPFSFRRKVGSSTLCHTVCHFLTQTTDHLSDTTIVECEQQDNQATSRKATKVSQTLNQDNVSTVPRRCHCRSDSRRSTADH